MDQFLTVELFWASVVLTIVGCCISLYFLVFNVHYRNHRLIKMSSPYLNIVTSFGSFLLNICCLLYGLDVFTEQQRSVTTLTCQIRLWLLVCSSTLVLAPILAKSWRVNQIFKKAAFKRVIIKDCRLLSLVAINVLVDMIFMILWQTLDPLKYGFLPLIPQGLKSFHYTNITNILIVVPVCHCNFYPAWMSFLFVYKGAILVYGLYIAWEIRNITLPSMDEAKATIIIIFTIIIICSSAVPISHLIQQWPVAVKSYNILAIWLCTLITQCMIFVPKVLLWRKSQDDNVHLTVSQQVTYSSNDSSYEDMSHLVVENSALKKSLQEKEQLIQNLQQHLITAKDKLLEISSEDVKNNSSLEVDLTPNLSSDDNHLAERNRETDTNSSEGTDFYPASCPIIKDCRLLSLVAINVLVDMIFMILWQTLDPLKYGFLPLIPQGLKSFHYTNITNILIVVPVCHCNFYPAWMSFLFVYKGAILVYGLYIAWEIRNITLPSMDEAKATIIIIFTIIIICSSAVPISHLIQQWPVAVKSYNILAIWLCTLITQCMIFVPKVLLWRKSQDDNVHLTVSQQVTYSSNDSSYEDMSHLVVENSALKKSLQEKEQLIQNLQQHLITAKDKLLEISSEDVKNNSSLEVDLTPNLSSDDNHLAERNRETDTNSSEGTDFYPASCPVSIDRPAHPSVYKCHNINSLYEGQLKWVRRKHSSKSIRSSLRSVSTEFRLAQLRDSIANELNQAQNLSSTLRDSISKDLNISHKENTWVQDAIPMKKTDIAGSIAKSYDLSDDSDTYSYVSSYVPSWTSPYSANIPTHQSIYASSESLTTLGNDKLYPSTYDIIKRKHKRKRHCHNSHKREIKKKVYIIQDSKIITHEHLEVRECPRVMVSQDTVV